MPPFDVRGDEPRKLVVATVTGRFEAREILDVVTQARLLSAARGWNILYDMRAAIPGAMGSGELFWMPRKAVALKHPAARRTRVACLHLAEFAEFASFWETTFTNAGLQARAFTEEASAVEWLRG